jgi:hypothetical protein
VAVVDRVGRAVLPADGQLRFVRRARDHAGAEGEADLDRGDADAARRAQHQQGLARLQRAAIAQGMLARAICEQECRRFLIGHRVGDAVQFRRLDRHFFRERADADRRHHAIAGCHQVHICANFFHDAGQLAAR